MALAVLAGPLAGCRTPHPDTPPFSDSEREEWRKREEERKRREEIDRATRIPDIPQGEIDRLTRKSGM